MPASPSITAQQFRDIQDGLGWSNAKMADRLHVSLSLVEKHRSGRQRIRGPLATLVLALAVDAARIARIEARHNAKHQ